MALLTERRTLVDQEPVVIDSFDAMTQVLGVSSQEIAGHVLIVGQGRNFSEQKLLGLQESLTLVDLHSDPRDAGLVAKEFHPGQLPDLAKGAVNYYQWSLERALSGINQPTFDRAMFFRVADFEGQFPQVLNTVGRVLNSGGLFMGSGGFISVDSARGYIDGQFLMEKTAALPNPDYSGKGYQGQNIGFVLRKQ